MASVSMNPDEPPVVLPEPVRHRVVALGSRALDEIDERQLPPSLRKVARFTPSRRARLAATAVASAL
ncbi:MAG: NYN domain-containing protein, partial [Nocardioidaceae bacterium]